MGEYDMITVQIFADGSALRTWSHSSGINRSFSLSPADVQRALKSICANDPDGCGMCGDCAIKAAWKKNKA